MTSRTSAKALTQLSHVEPNLLGGRTSLLVVLPKRGEALAIR
jgi:hypothetical protein